MDRVVGTVIHLCAVGGEGEVSAAVPDSRHFPSSTGVDGVFSYLVPIFIGCRVISPSILLSVLWFSLFRLFFAWGGGVWLFLGLCFCVFLHITY